MTEDYPVVEKFYFKPKDYNSKETESNRLELPNGVVIRFNRYGVRLKDDDKVYQDFNLRADTPVNIGSHEYCRRHITHGYLYMYSAKLKKIVEYGIIAGIIMQLENKWDDNTPDIRPLYGGSYENYMYLNKGNVYEFAYSQIQWSAKYVQLMTSDSSLREKRFQKVDTLNLDENPDITNFDNIKIWHNKEISGKEESIAHDKHILGLSEINVLEDKTPYIFLSLHDPVGCANDLRSEQERYQLQLTEMMNSMIIPKDGSSGSQEDLGYLHQHASTFYRMFYSPTSKSDVRFDSFREKIVEENFLRKILLVKERAKIRDKINNTRLALLRLLDSEYYQSAIEELEHVIPYHRECGLTLIGKHHEGIVSDASLIDRHLDVEDTSARQINQEVVAYMKKTKEEGHVIDKLLSMPCDLEDEILFIDDDDDDKPFNEDEAIQRADLLWANLANVLIVWETQLEALTKTTTTLTGPSPLQGTPKITKPTVVSTAKRGDFLVIPEKWLNKVEIRKRGITRSTGTINKKTFWVLDKIKLEEILTEMYCSIGEKFQGGWGPGSKGKTGVPKKNIAEIKGLLLDGYKANAIIDVIIDPEKTPVLDLSKTSEPPPVVETKPNVKKSRFSNVFKLKILRRALESKAFMGVTGLLSAANLVANFRSADKSKGTVYYDSCIGAAVTELTQFIFYFVSKSPTTFGVSANIWTSLSGASGVASSLFLGVTCFLDALDAFSENDNYTGLAYLGSAISWLAAAGLSSARLMKTPPRWARNKWLIITYILGVGLMLLAAYLTRSPLEKYLANCILQKNAMDIKNWESKQSYEITAYLCKNRAELIDNTFEKWRDFKVSLETFNTLLMNMEVRPRYRYQRIPASTKWWNLTYFDQYIFRDVSVDCWYGENLTINSSVEYGLRVFYTKPDYGFSSLFYRDLDGTFSETSLGCSFSIGRSEIEIRMPVGARIHRMYVFQRVLDRNGIPYPPPDDKGEEVYYIQRVHYDHSLDTEVAMSPLGFMDIYAFSGSKDKAPLSFSRLFNIIKEDFRFKKSQIVNNNIKNGWL